MKGASPLAYTERGQGPAVVLLHGFPLNRTLWQSQQESLKGQFRVITPDLRGHGESAAPEGKWSMQAMAADVVELLDALRIERAAVVGHSMGGYVALALWAVAPERVAALGLISTQAGADDAEARAKRYQLADAVAAGGATVIADAMASKLFGPATPPEDTRVQLVRTMMLNTAPRAIAASLHAMADRPDRMAVLPLIKVPTLVLTGAADKVIPPARSEAMAAALPAGILVQVPDVGHLPMLEDPAATLTALQAFLADAFPAE